MDQTQLLDSIKKVITESRQRVFRMANSALLQTYWQIGKLIIDEEQNGNEKAEYGKATLRNLAKQLTLEFGKGFDYTNLTNMRKFFLAFPILDALRQELSWTHYRLICRLDSEEKRNYYLNESVATNWNSRTLQRQINSMAFERVLEHQSGNPETNSIQNFIKDPYIFEFLGLPTHSKKLGTFHRNGNH